MKQYKDINDFVSRFATVHIAGSEGQMTTLFGNLLKQIGLPSEVLKLRSMHPRYKDESYILGELYCGDDIWTALILEVVGSELHATTISTRKTTQVWPVTSRDMHKPSLCMLTHLILTFDELKSILKGWLGYRVRRLDTTCRDLVTKLEKAQAECLLLTEACVPTPV